jgi:hypothetical protein
VILERGGQRNATPLWMSDELQFVNAARLSTQVESDKLKFVGHKAPSPLRSAGALNS